MMMRKSWYFYFLPVEPYFKSPGQFNLSLSVVFNLSWVILKINLKDHPVCSNLGLFPPNNCPGPDFPHSQGQAENAVLCEDFEIRHQWHHSVSVIYAYELQRGRRAGQGKREILCEWLTAVYLISPSPRLSTPVPALTMAWHVKSAPPAMPSILSFALYSLAVPVFLSFSFPNI